LLDRFANRAPVGLIAELDDREEDQLLEFTQIAHGRSSAGLNHTVALIRKKAGVVPAPGEPRGETVDNEAA
jgi:hypothetical protein